VRSASRKLTAVFIGGIATSLAVSTPSASAWVDGELQFVDEMRAAGLGVNAGVDELVAFGWSICSDLGSFSAAQIAKEQAKHFGVAESRTAAAVAAAERNMCPGA
jgi:hypothetical protein